MFIYNEDETQCLMTTWYGLNGIQAIHISKDMATLAVEEEGDGYKFICRHLGLVEDGDGYFCENEDGLRVGLGDATYKVKEFDICDNSLEGSFLKDGWIILKLFY